MRVLLTKYLPFIIVAIVSTMLLSLHFGWLHFFFFDAEHATTQGIDYFAVPKSFLNLLEKRSAFDTWGGTPYGPYATWYLAHPAFSIFVASWFSFFTPWVGYWIFIFFSLGIIFYTAYSISKLTNDVFKKQLVYLILLCGFPTYWMLFVGNMHAPLVLALTLILIAIYELTYSEKISEIKLANGKLFAGLLISFFSKPIVLLMLPIFLLTKETRKTTLKSILIYAVVSFLFIVIPVLNPQGMGLNKLANIAFDFNFIKENMNIYKNHFVLNDYMKDNSIHWLNLIAQSDYKLMHIDVFSLPVFVDTIVGRETSASIYKIPIYIGLLLSIAIPFIENKKIRLESTLLLLMAISLTFFLSYNTVWEYQYSSALPIVALLPILKEKNVFYKKYISILFFTGIFFCLPSLYFFVRQSNFQSVETQTLIRITRVVPALILFVLMIVCIFTSVVKHAQFSKLKEWENLPTKLFFD